jgi:hypothetical protein
LNHAVHLNPEGLATNNGMREILACDSCHQPASDRSLMEPVNHELHCSRCHRNALTFDTNWFRDRPAPHKDPETVRAVVRDRYAEHLRQNAELLEDMGREGTGRRVVGQGANADATKAVWERVQQKTQGAERVLFEGAGGCRYCHEVSRNDAGWSITRPDIPKHWFTRARFQHDSHRMLSCVACHEAQSSTQTSDVLLPSINSCRACHEPSRGVRSDCTECHTYHDRSRERSLDGPIGRVWAVVDE